MSVAKLVEFKCVTCDIQVNMETQYGAEIHDTLVEYAVFSDVWKKAHEYHDYSISTPFVATRVYKPVNLKRRNPEEIAKFILGIKHDPHPEDGQIHSDCPACIATLVHNKQHTLGCDEYHHHVVPKCCNQDCSACAIQDAADLVEPLRKGFEGE